ncbi:MAG: NADH dehydrogenase [Acidimicrobiales bacterium]|nr:MAG: NADH dehydrogenase [Acidimicrobiales bacterium]
MSAQDVYFTIVAVLMVVSALRVVTCRNIVHAALWLIVVLAGAAVQYLILAAEFIALVQVLIYLGAIIVLFLFGIMLTRAPMGPSLFSDRRHVLTGVVVSVPLFALLCWTLWDAFESREIELRGVQRVGEVGDTVFSQYIVPFEAVSVLLLAALIGAIVLARKE